MWLRGVGSWTATYNNLIGAAPMYHRPRRLSTRFWARSFVQMLRRVFSATPKVAASSFGRAPSSPNEVNAVSRSWGGSHTMRAGEFLVMDIARLNIQRERSMQRSNRLRFPIGCLHPGSHHQWSERLE